MAKVIALVSKSTRLLISLHNEDCGFSISEDRTTLIFDSRFDVSNTSLQLSTQGKKIHTFDFPCIRRGRMNSVRMDALFPLVFGKVETVYFVLNGSAYQLWPFDGKTVNLRVKLTFGSGDSSPRVRKINSVSLTVKSTKVLVSREVLGFNSDFFSTLFYGDFAEKNSGLFVIKEVDAQDFTWLNNSLVERKWNFASVEQALSVMTIADQFCMNNVLKHILSYLKTINGNLPLKMLNRFVSLASRCKDNGEFVSWIFEICQSTTGLTAVAESCGPSITPYLPLFFQFLASKQEDEKKKNAEKMEKLTRESEAKDVWYSEKNKLAVEKRILSEQYTSLVKQQADEKTKNAKHINVLVKEIARLRGLEKLIILPSTVTFPATGGTSIHTLINSGDCKVMYQTLSTNWEEYDASDDGFIDAGASTQLEIVRLSGPPGEATFAIEYAPAPVGATDATEAFDGIAASGEVDVCFKAE